MRLFFYLTSRALMGIGTALATVTSVILFVAFVELSRALGGRGEVDFVRLCHLSLLQTPSLVLQLLPFIFLFGAMATFVSLNRRNELTAMRAAGVSAWMFLLPSVTTALIFGAIAVAVLNPAAAALNGQFEERKTALAEGVPGAIGGEIWTRQAQPQGQMVIHAKAVDTSGGRLRLRGVSIFIQNIDNKGDLRFSRRIEAEAAILEPGYWRLTKASEARPGSETLRSETLSLPARLNGAGAMQKFVNPAAVSTWDLGETIRAADLAGYSSVAYRLRFQQLIALPVLLAAMTLLAATFSLGLLRLGGMARMAIAGVALGFTFFFINQVCGALATTNVIPIGLAAWTPPLLALLSAATLLCYREDG